MSGPDDRAPPRPQPIRRCPVCGKPALDASKPFCSPRCADIDLHRWLGGVYAIPAEPDAEHDVGDEDG